MATHEIVVRGEREGYQEFLATGLKGELANEPPMLLVRYDAGDCDTPKTWNDLYEACYDAHQMYDGWQTGDLLSFQGTIFARIESFEVLAQKSALLPNGDAFRATELPRNR